MESEKGPEEGFAPVDPVPAASPAPPALPASPAPPESQPYPTQPWPGYGQMPPYGYPPYGYGYDYPQRPTGTNGMAIAALVLGICGFLFVTPIVGLVLGLVALAAVRKSGQKGKGLAISGIVLSGGWIAIFATLIVVAVVTQPEPPRRDAGGTVVGKGSVSIYGLRAKDCFTIPPGLIGSTDSKTRTLTVVPCSTPHDSEAFGSFTSTDGAYPGMDGMRTESGVQCYKVLGSYLLDAQSLPSNTLVQFIYPNAQAWGQGEHSVTCFLQFPAATMTQSVQRAASSYNADQLRYLNAVHPLVDALSRLNATPHSADLTLLQQRASDIAAADQNEVDALTSAPWPADIQADVDSLVAEHQAAAALWAQAETATGVSAFSEIVRQAGADFDGADMTKVRGDLGLTSFGGGSGGSGDSGDTGGSSGGGNQVA